MNRLDRLTAIMIQLQTKRLVRARELADRFGISLRTVYRDVRSLEAAGVPVIGEAGAGYSLVDGYRLPPVHFTQGEAAAFLTAEKLVEHFTDTGIFEAYQSGMLKIRAVLRLTEKDLVENLENAVQVEIPPVMAEEATHMPVVLQAIAHRTVLSLVYKGKNDEAPQHRDIEPVGIFYENYAWYTLAWCRLREDFRNFRLDRMLRLTNTGETFSDRSLSLSGFLQERDNTYALLEAWVTVPEEVAPYIAQQRGRQGFVREKKQGKHIRMLFHTHSYEFLARWVMQFADQVTALEPQALADSFRELVADAAKNLQHLKSC